MEKKLVIFAIPANISDEQEKEFVQRVIEAAFETVKGISSIDVKDVSELALQMVENRIQLSKHMQYINDIAKVIGNDSFNKLMPTKKFWENVTNKTPGFNEKMFSGFLDEYSTNINLRDCVEKQQLTFIVKLIKQAYEMLK